MPPVDQVEDPGELGRGAWAHRGVARDDATPDGRQLLDVVHDLPCSSSSSVMASGRRTVHSANAGGLRTRRT